MGKDQIVFAITRADVEECVSEMGLSQEIISDEFLEQIKETVAWGLECWSDTVKAAINFALKN